MSDNQELLTQLSLRRDMAAYKALGMLEHILDDLPKYMVPIVREVVERGERANGRDACVAGQRHMSDDERDCLRILGTLFALHALIGKHHVLDMNSVGDIARGAVAYAEATIEALEEEKL